MWGFTSHFDVRGDSDGVESQVMVRLTAVFHFLILGISLKIVWSDSLLWATEVKRERGTSIGQEEEQVQ